MNIEVPLLILMIFTIVAADMVALKTSNLLAAVISFGTVGFGLIVAYMILQAPDVCITQIVVEVAVLVTLILANVHRDRSHVSGEHEPLSVAWGFVLVLLMLIVVAGVFVQIGLPRFGEPVMTRVAGTSSQHFIENGLKETGAANAVSAILLDYRGYDTLGEATVLFAAVIGVVTLLRKSARKKEEGEAS
ncbi:MAG TPA: DUF4040 domain-containing protein [Planctomycetes bacterium]|nr:DUF4040 domain-containing protein [Planctomycetota bacterium]